MERRGIRSALLTLLVGVALMGPSLAEDEAEVHVIADFEGGESNGIWSATRTGGKCVRDAASGGGQVLRWTQDPAKDGGWLTVVGLPVDVRPFRTLRLRARCIGAYANDATVRLRSRGASLSARLTGLTEEWKTIEILLPEMIAQGPFAPDKVSMLRFVCWETKGFSLEFDDIALVKGKGGWRFTQEDLQARGIDTSGPRYRIGNFEDEKSLGQLKAAASSVELVPAKPRRKGQCLRWKVSQTAKTVWLTLATVPEDLREYRFLRMKVRTKKAIQDEIHVRIRGGEGHLSGELPPLKKKVWNDVEISIPTMDDDDEFNAEAVWGVRLVVWEPQGFELDLDDIELVKGAGGWRMSKEENLAFLFGEKRKKKVKEIETDHFRIYTDSSAAKGKFPRALERVYDFICQTLLLQGFSGQDKLDVFIFQNPNLYFDFCVRRGWSREAAERTAGHAWSDFFATYYQAPKSPTVTHELTHSVFHRTRGTGGGSWFQEGAAVCVEERSQKRDAATMFAPQLRSEQYLPLAEFVTTTKLIRSHDVSGGARTAHSLYTQAGALFEFLLRGPLAAKHPDAMKQLARLDWNARTIVKDVERIYGCPLAEIESAWLEWGADPPKLKK